MKEIARNRRVRTLVVVLVLVALAGPLAAASTASASTNIGRYGSGTAQCGPSGMLVTGPQMWPAPRDTVSNALTIGGGQWVAYRSHLTRYYAGTGWVTVASAPWKKGFVNYDQTMGMGTTSWTTLSGSPISPSHTFSIGYYGTRQSPVYYSVYTEYYWYPDADHRTAGYTSSWNPHVEQRLSAYDTSTYQWCKYPLPNPVS